MLEDIHTAVTACPGIAMTTTRRRRSSGTSCLEIRDEAPKALRSRRRRRRGVGMGRGYPSPQGIWGSVVSSPCGVPGGAPAENEFGAY